MKTKKHRRYISINLSTKILVVLLLCISGCVFFSVKRQSGNENNSEISKIFSELTKDDIIYGTIHEPYSLFTDKSQLIKYEDKTSVKKFGDKKYYYLGLISPYECGGCDALGSRRFNKLAEDFPGQVVMIVADYYRKETVRAIKDSGFKNIPIYLDVNAEILENIKRIHKGYDDNWHFIVDSEGNIVFSIVLTTNVLNGKESRRVWRIIKSYLEQ